MTIGENAGVASSHLSSIPPATSLTHIVDGAVIFQAGSYPFNVDISGETPTAVFDCEGHCANKSVSYTQVYVLHVDGNTPTELEPVACNACGKHPTIPDQPFSPYATLQQIVGKNADHAFEAVDPSNKLAYEVYDVQGTPPTDTNAYSGCVDPIGWNVQQNTNYGPCNGESGWHDNVIAGGLAPEEVTGIWPQPNGTVNHGMVFQESGCNGGYCGSAPQCIRLNTSKVGQPTGAEAKALYYGLSHYCSWTTDGGSTLGFSRLFLPQSGDANFSGAFITFITSLKTSDFDVMPCAFENDGSPPTC